MRLTWESLNILQRRLLTTLDDGYPHKDSVGLPIEGIRPELLLAAGSLCVLGLVEQSFGWRGTWWLRLTEAGRQVEDGGAVE